MNLNIKNYLLDERGKLNTKRVVIAGLIVVILIGVLTSVLNSMFTSGDGDEGNSFQVESNIPEKRENVSIADTDELDFVKTKEVRAMINNAFSDFQNEVDNQLKKSMDALRNEQEDEVKKLGEDIEDLKNKKNFEETVKGLKDEINILESEIETLKKRNEYLDNRVNKVEDNAGSVNTAAGDDYSYIPDGYKDENESIPKPDGGQEQGMDIPFVFTSVIRGEKNVAILRNGDQTRMVEIGDYYRGYKIKEITDRHIEVEKNGESRTHGLNEGGSDD